MIKPIVGQVVWYWSSNAARVSGEQPFSAQIARVWTDTCVNIGYLDGNGQPKAATSVRLVQEGEDYPSSGPFCEWMPYQKGQAAKTEAAEKAVEAVKQDGSLKAVQNLLDKHQFMQSLPQIQVQPPHKVTQDDVNRAIAMCEYHVFAGRLTIAILTLRNGFLVTGESSCVSSAEFNVELGRKYALQDAERKVWMLLGYQLKEEQYQHSKTRMVDVGVMAARGVNPGLTD